MNVLDAQLEKVGTMSWHQVYIHEKEDEKFDGLCRSRTYGPLIKSERKGMTQVVECLGHPLVMAGDRRSCLLALTV